MNPSRNPATSRFIRGRGRGGGAYRPYFYFKRNGKTIPAYSRGNGPGTSRARGGARANITNVFPNRLQNVPALAPTFLNSSFVRPQLFAVPEDVQQQTQTVIIEAPNKYPGWRLYFYKEPLVESSELVKHIQCMETHFKDRVAHYDYLEIHKKCYFELKASIIQQDEALKESWPSLMDDLVKSPFKTLATIGMAMHSLATSAAFENWLSQDADSNGKIYIPRVRPQKVYVRPTGFITEEAAIATKNSLSIEQLLCVRGRVKQIGPVSARASWVAYKCARCKHEQALKQTGFKPCCPDSCKRQGCLAKQDFIELRSSPFTRITPKQRIRLTEMCMNVLYDSDLDNSNYMDVELKYDLVDTIHLGQEILVTGVLKMRPLQEEQLYDKTINAMVSTTEIYMKAISIVDAKYCPYKFTEKDLKDISAINDDVDSFKLLVQSLAPEVHGHEMAKAGVLLSLIGGAGSQVHEEEEINVLLVGDPGVGKSNIIQQCSKVSQKGCLVQVKRGNTISATKLTPAIKGRNNKLTLQSGGLLNSTYGHCSIDDLDRLGSEQESLINVLQSKLSCISLSSICSTIQTPTAIIATANTISGHYDQSKLLTDNIRLNHSLLREFHLVFLMLDKPNKEMDTSLTEHVRALHDGRKKSTTIAIKYEEKPKTSNSMTISFDEERNTTEKEEDYNLGLRLKLNATEELEMDLLPPLLIKKFIAYARQQVKPLLVPEAAEDLKEFYFELRKQSDSTISSGHLAGLIRLCQARARIDFSSEVTKVHVRDIISLVRQSNADMAVSDIVDINPNMPSTSRGAKQKTVQKFLELLQLRSSALVRRIFEYDEIKEIARRVGVPNSGINQMIDMVNLHGILIKKGPNMYEFNDSLI